MGHEKEREGNEFEFSSSSRSLEFGFSSKFIFSRRAAGGVEFSSSSSSVRTSFFARCGGSSSVRVPVQFGVQGLLTAERERFGILLNSKVSNSNLIRCQFRN